MYELKNGKTYLRISDDLEMLEYGNDSQSYHANSPFQFLWTPIPISAKEISQKNVTVSDSCISIDLAGFTFLARFPGNTYCRPEPRFTPDLRISITLRLDGTDLVINASPIENIGDCDCHLYVLLAQGLMNASTQEKAALYIPADYGIRFDFPRNDIFSRSFSPSFNWTLPVHGLFTPKGGIGLWCEDYDRDYVLSYNMDRKGTINMQCREIYDSMANEPRELRFMLFDAGSDFRQLARRCRELRIASGRFQTLLQKFEKRPVAAQLPGTVLWKHNVFFRSRPEGVEKTYSLYTARPDWIENEGLPGNWTAAEVFETAKARGFDRVAVCNTGWNHDGFDAGYPTRFPINPERGTEEEFRAAAKYAQTLSPGYFLNVHDNYEDAYAGEEYKDSEMTQLQPGAPRLGGVWRGGQAHKLCSINGLKYAKRDLPRLASITGPGCIYLDVIGGSALVSCWSKEHPQTRHQDWLTKREIFKLATDLFGALAIEGCGTDMYADIADIGAYGRLHLHSFPARADGPKPVPVPMWQLVYHDCILNYFGEGYSPVHGSEYRLYQALYTLLPTSFDDNSHRISFELRSAFTAAMLDFEELEPRTVTYDDDGSYHTHGVARSVYADGTEVIANFNDEPYLFNGTIIAPREYIIKHQG